MEHFAGLDVGVKETSVCVVDKDGTILLEASVPTDPDILAATLKPWRRSLRRVGHEAGSLSPWLQRELEARGVPAACLDAFAARDAMKAQRNKTDKHDARAIAHLMRMTGRGASRTGAPNTGKTPQLRAKPRPTPAPSPRSDLPGLRCRWKCG